MLKNKPKIIVVTGAESTGKSVLCEWLSKYFHAPFIPEFAREYVEKLGRPYQYNDVEEIARKQVNQLNEYKDQMYPLLFVDTWLIITKIWFEEVFKTVPDWLTPVLQNSQIDLFLVCDTDLPWIPDKVRENGGKKRNYLQSRYIETIEEYCFQYKKISGKDENRFQNAVQTLEQFGIVKPNHT